jgi:hypothetical protein
LTNNGIITTVTKNVRTSSTENIGIPAVTDADDGGIIVKQNTSKMLVLNQTSSSSTNYNWQTTNGENQTVTQNNTIAIDDNSIPSSSSMITTNQVDLVFNIPFGRYDTGITNICSTLQSQPYPWIKRDDEKGLKSNITAQFNYCHDHRIGNGLSQYFFNRIIAAYAGINYELDRSSCRGSENVISLLGDPVPLNISNNSDVTWKDYCSSCINDKYSLRRWPHGCRNWDVSSLIPAMKQEFKSLTEKTLQRHPEMEKEIDDVAIHVRLGDVLGGGIRNMGILPFQAYLDIIPLNVSSIGIVTAPAAPGSDADIIVNGLRDFLLGHFSKANITIRNSPTDSASMVFTRLIKARKHAICTASTFCMHPTMGSEAVGVMFWNSKHPNWLDKLNESNATDILAPMMTFLESKDFPKPNNKSLGNLLVDILSNMNGTEYKVSSYEEWNESILPYYKL